MAAKKIERRGGARKGTGPPRQHYRIRRKLAVALRSAAKRTNEAPIAILERALEAYLQEIKEEDRPC